MGEPSVFFLNVTNIVMGGVVLGCALYVVLTPILTRWRRPRMVFELPTKPRH